MRNYDKQTLLALNAMCHTCLYHREDCRCNKPTSTTASTKEPSAMTDHELSAAIDLAELKHLKPKRDEQSSHQETATAISKSLKQARSDWGLSVHDQCKRCGYDKDICGCNA
jgi:hypothetical protein